MCFVIPSLQSSNNYFRANAFVVCMRLSHPFATPQTKTFHTFFYSLFSFSFSHSCHQIYINFFFTEVVYLILKIALEIKMHQLKMYFSMSFLIFRNNTVKRTNVIGKRYLVASLEAA